MGKLTRLTFATATAAFVLAALEAAAVLGAPVPDPVLTLAAAVTLVLAALAAVRDVASIWRGPVVFSFGRDEAVLCDAAEAAAVRSAAQLRGTMGGAGHVFPLRLAFPALAWAAIAAQAAALLEPGERSPEPWAFAAVALAYLLIVAFPTLSFCYREATGGCVLVYPPGACRRLLERAGVRPAVTPLPLGGSGRRGAEGASGAATAEAESSLRCEPARPDA